MGVYQYTLNLTVLSTVFRKNLPAFLEFLHADGETDTSIFLTQKEIKK